MADGLAFEGDVVERQSFLNGTRYLLIEGEGDGWSVQLALTLPREEGAPIVEGDLTLTADRGSWYGSIAEGSHRHAWDEALDAATIEIRLDIVRSADAESSEPWPRAQIAAVLRGDDVRLTITPVEEP